MNDLSTDALKFLHDVLNAVGGMNLVQAKLAMEVDQWALAQIGARSVASAVEPANDTTATT